jgi:hypothetical protein
MGDSRKEAYLWDKDNNLGYFVESEDDDLIADDVRPRIEPCTYLAIGQGTDVNDNTKFGRKLYIRFAVISGKNDGVKLFMACPYSKEKPKSNKKFIEQWTLANQGPRKPGQKMARNIFTGKKFLVLVRNTKRKFPNGKIKPDYLQYSVVDTILEVSPDD